MAGTEADARLLRVEDEHAAVRHIAMLVADRAPASELFAAVVEELVRLLGVPGGWLFRYEGDRCVSVLASSNVPGYEVGTRYPLDGPSVSARVLDTGRPAHVEEYAAMGGTIATLARDSGFRSGLGVPVTVDGALWGVLCAGATSDEPLPDDAEERLRGFTELVAAAIANAEARGGLSRLADEQAALHRVAMLVARGGAPQTVFDAICREAGQLFGASSVNLARFTADGFYVAVAGWSERGTHIAPGTRVPLGLRSTVAAPILVEGQTWGAVIAGRDSSERFPIGAERRIARFADLAATAIASASARSELIASRARIVAAGDEARTRVERNLHDGVQQRLVALGLELQVARGMLRPDQERAKDAVEHVEREIELVLDDVRDLARGLHPPLLASRGLGPALRVLATRSPIHVDLEINLSGRPPASVETAVYYAVSEALANANRYSHASRIRVQISERPDESGVSATIVDDGVGGAVLTPGSSLLGLTDRIAALGGHLALASLVGQGTTVSVDLPNRAPAETGVGSEILASGETLRRRAERRAKPES